MATFYMNEGAFDLPDLGFTDQTVHLFSAPLEGGGELGLVIARSKLPPGKTLADVVAAHVERESKTLRAFSVLSRREAQLENVPAIDVACRYRSGAEMTYQRQFHFVAYGLWLLVGTSAPLEKRAACDECLGHVLGSFRLREM
jgi:hypothetical protein